MTGAKIFDHHHKTIKQVTIKTDDLEEYDSTPDSSEVDCTFDS